MRIKINLQNLLLDQPFTEDEFSCCICNWYDYMRISSYRDNYW